MAQAVSVKAGPGTGKTGTLTAGILHLLKERGAKPSEITAVTFTNTSGGGAETASGEADRRKKTGTSPEYRYISFYLPGNIKRE